MKLWKHGPFKCQTPQCSCTASSISISAIFAKPELHKHRQTCEHTNEIEHNEYTQKDLENTCHPKLHSQGNLIADANNAQRCHRRSSPTLPHKQFIVCVFSGSLRCVCVCVCVCVCTCVRVSMITRAHVVSCNLLTQWIELALQD